MTKACFIRSRKAFIYVGNSTFHSRLFDGRACDIQVICGEYAQNLVRNHLIKYTKFQHRSVTKGGADNTSANPCSAKCWRRCVPRLLLRGSLQVTRARLPASFCAIA